jgi:hypothetical protein
MHLYFSNAAWYNFAALGVDERCRTPRHPKGQLEPNVLALLAGVISGGLDFAPATIYFHNTR